MVRAILVALAVASMALAAVACGDGDDEPAVTIERLTPTARATAAAGKGAARITPTPRAEPSSTAAAAEPTSEPTQAPATEPPPPPTPRPDGPPSSGRWIEVDVTNFVVRLMDGAAVVQEIAPVGVGEQVDTGEYLSTQTGLFYVHNKVEDLVYDAPFDTYISHWVGFDPDKDNGFHSFLKDAQGNVVDPSTGRVSNGCIRTGAPEAIFAYAEIGMPVWVHW